jgi:hypothetical protein
MKMKMTCWSIFAGLILLSAGNAFAQTTCDTDKDCPGTACGTQVCIKSSGAATCMDANTAGQSGVSDGWCNTADDCKCKSLGAVCNVFCSFTIPPDGGATGGSGGSTGTGGGGCSIAGAPSLAGAVGMSLLAAALIRRRARRRA